MTHACLMDWAANLQVMTWWLNLLLIYCQLHPWVRSPMKLYLQYEHGNPRKRICNWSSWKSSHFVDGWLCETCRQFPSQVATSSWNTPQRITNDPASQHSQHNIALPSTRAPLNKGLTNIFKNIVIPQAEKNQNIDKLVFFMLPVGNRRTLYCPMEFIVSHVNWNYVVVNSLSLIDDIWRYALFKIFKGAGVFSSHNQEG